MKKGVRILLYCIFAVIFITSVLTIDYSVAKITGNRLIFAIKKEYEKEQYIEYNGLFYKMWICTAEENNYKLGKSRKDAPDCPKAIIFEGDKYITYEGLELTRKEYDIIKDYYTYDFINSFKIRDDVDKALLISEEMHSKMFSTKEGYSTIIDGKNYMIAMFEKLTELNDGTWDYKIDESDLSTHYCIKYSDDKTEFMFSKYDGETCPSEFEGVSFTKAWCDAVEASEVIEIVKTNYDNYCK